MEKKNNKIKKKDWICSILSVILVAAFPVLFIYFQNVSEIMIKDIIGILLIYIAVSLVIWGVLSIITRKPQFSSVVTVISVILLSNMSIGQKVLLKLFSSIKYWHVLAICLYVIILAAILLTFVKTDLMNDIVMVQAIVLMALILINAVPSIPQIIAKAGTESSGAASNLGYEQGHESNVYWFIFDECGSFKTMKNYYDYDNTQLKDYLSGAGFTNSENSYNECGSTEVVLTNCLNLNYVANTNMDATKLKSLRQDVELVNVFREHKYAVQGIGDTGWLGIDSKTTDKEASGKTVEGYEAKDIVISNSFLAPFIQYTGTEASKIVLDTFAYYKDANNIHANNSEFNMLYVCSPHQPFFFDKDGNDVAIENYNNWSDEKYYLEQYQYVSKQIIEMVENIKRNDPDSVIILESDHGPRFNHEMSESEKLSIFNSVYYKGESIDEIKDMSGVNTIRTILNKLWGTNYEILEVKEGE